MFDLMVSIYFSSLLYPLKGMLEINQRKKCTDGVRYQSPLLTQLLVGESMHKDPFLSLLVLSIKHTLLLAVSSFQNPSLNFSHKFFTDVFAYPFFIKKCFVATILDR